MVQLGKSHEITVNTLAPGVILTDMAAPYMLQPDGSPSGFLDGAVSTARAESRVGTPEDMGDAALVLASEKSRWITAQWISVSGGAVW